MSLGTIILKLNPLIPKKIQKDEVIMQGHLKLILLA
jgi:hypothetical protein